MADENAIAVPVTAAGKALMDDATAADQRTTLELEIGTDVQAYDSGLNSIAGLTTVANNLIYTTASDTYAVITPANSSLLVTSGAGVPSLSTAIPDGVTATTQAASDNSTKVATTAYVDAAVVGGGGGKILQVVAGTPLTTTASTTSTSYVATGLTASITPSSTSSKILVLCHLSGGASSTTYNPDFQLQRGATGICVATSVASRTAATTGISNYSSNSLGSAAISYLDSPATTSATTYTVDYRAPSGTVYMNRGKNDTNSATFPRGTSTIILLEVDGT